MTEVMYKLKERIDTFISFPSNMLEPLPIIPSMMPCDGNILKEMRKYKCKPRCLLQFDYQFPLLGP